MFFLAVGGLFSSMTRHQMTAAVMTLSVVALFFMVGLLGFLSGHAGPVQQAVTLTVSPIEQMAQFSRGIIDTRPVVWYLVMTGLFLFLTLQSFQSRRWKK
jgi:ABC-2 type transport system permease protein